MVFGILVLIGIDEVQKNISCISIGYYHVPIRGGYTPLDHLPKAQPRINNLAEYIVIIFRVQAVYPVYTTWRQ